MTESGFKNSRVPDDVEMISPWHVSVPRQIFQDNVHERFRVDQINWHTFIAELGPGSTFNWGYLCRYEDWMLKRRASTAYYAPSTATPLRQQLRQRLNCGRATCTLLPFCSLARPALRDFHFVACILTGARPSQGLERTGKRIYTRHRATPGNTTADCLSWCQCPHCRNGKTVNC